MFQKMKDTALSKGAQVAINSQIETYGEVQHIYLDSKNKTIELEVLLDGEDEALKVGVSKYGLIEIDGKYQLKVSGVTTSRAWINTLAATHLEGKTFDVPSEYGKMLHGVLG